MESLIASSKKNGKLIRERTNVVVEDMKASQEKTVGDLRSAHTQLKQNADTISQQTIEIQTLREKSQGLESRHEMLINELEEKKSSLVQVQESCSGMEVSIRQAAETQRILLKDLEDIRKKHQEQERVLEEREV